MNNQTRESIVRPNDATSAEPSNGQVIHWVKIWDTFQGEGPLTGFPAVFLRLAGCNLQCRECDTDYTTGRRVSQIDEIVEAIFAANPNTPLVVITGGEPFRQNIVPLLSKILERGVRVQVETNGTHFQDGIMDMLQNIVPHPSLDLEEDEPFDPELWIVCSPKTRGLHPQAAQLVDFWKYVVEDGHVDDDGFPTRVLGSDLNVARPTNPNPVYVQPMDTTDPVKNKLNLAQAMRTSRQTGMILSIQIHKLIGVE